MLITAILNHYLRNHIYGLSDTYVHQLRVSLSAWERHMGRRLDVEDLADDKVNGYLDWLRKNRRPDTVRTRRGNLLILWHYAFQEGFTDLAPRRVRKLRPIARIPTAWRLDEVRTLTAEARRLPGCFHGTRLRRSSWWESLVRAGYDTGLRLGDLLRLRAEDIGETMSVVQRKTGQSVSVRLRGATIAAIDQTLADEPRDVIWRLWATEETFYLHFRNLVAVAGIRPGTFRWLRRSAATQLERMEPGRGTELLGHRLRSTTEQWYIDRSQLDTAPLPPW